MSAYWKIPLQALVLMVGVFTFVFYLFHQPPLLFNPVHDERGARRARRAAEYRALEREFQRRVRGAAAGRGRSRRRASSGDVRAPAQAADAFRQQDAAVERVRARAIGSSCGRRPATQLHRRQLRLPDLHHDRAADRAGRPVDRRHHHRGHRHASPPS